MLSLLEAIGVLLLSICMLFSCFRRGLTIQLSNTLEGSGLVEYLLELTGADN